MLAVDMATMLPYLAGQGGNRTDEKVPTMAYITFDTVHMPLRASAERLFQRLGVAIEAYALRRGRRAQVEFLQGLSDAQLAERGLTRDAIVEHVFRDKLLSL